MRNVDVGVLLVEPSRLLRNGIRAELAASGVAVVAEASTAEEAVAAAAEHEPDVVVLSFELPDKPASELCSALREQSPTMPIVVLSEHEDGRSVSAAVDAGAAAYLLKDREDVDVADAIRRVLAGESVIDPRAAAALIDSRHRGDDPRLTSQELKVLRLAAEGLTNPEIGARLYLSRHTVKEYLSHAMRKLEAGNRIEAVRKATELGLIEGVAPNVTETLVYNETGEPIRSDDLRVTPLKIDQLETFRRPQ
jgi:DNA-binding NarL/FixJ family response regulator